ncbi:MAG: TAXI family TRAP transporter solute-binding subunit [Thainema sp.]
MQRKFLIPAVAVSIVAALGFAAKFVHDQNRVYVLEIATASRDGEYYAFSQALAEVANLYQPRLRIKVIETAGSVENMELLRRHQVDLAIVQSDTSVAPQVRGVAGLFPEVFHLIAASDAGIERVVDLRGKRVALMPEGSGSYALFWEIAHHYGLTEADIDYTAMSAAEAQSAFEQGQVDAISRIIALGNSSVRSLLQTTEAQFVPLDQAEAVQIMLPYLEPMSIPKGAYVGAPSIPAQNLPTVSVRALLVAHEDVDPVLIRQLTSLLYDYRSELIDRNPRAASISVPDSMLNLGLPLHEGARDYFTQDEPNFVVRYAEALGFLLSVSVLLGSGLWQLRFSLTQRQKNRADMYNLEILALIEQVYETDDPDKLEVIRRQLFDILQKVVDDLDLDRITPESFQSFTFPWDVAITTIRHRETLLNQKSLTSSEDAPANPKA